MSVHAFLIFVDFLHISTSILSNAANLQATPRIYPARTGAGVGTETGAGTGAVGGVGMSLMAAPVILQPGEAAASHHDEQQGLVYITETEVALREINELEVSCA